MAVQAQYPSNHVFLFNKNNNQAEGHIDYSLQSHEPEAGGGLFLDQSHVRFNHARSSGTNNLNNNPRKRGRTEAASPSIILNPLSNCNTTTDLQQSHHFPPPPPPPPQPHQPHQLMINLSQLHNHHQPHINVVSTGLRLSSGDQKCQLQQLHQNNLVSQSSTGFFSLSPDQEDSEYFASHIKQQRDELDRFLQAQAEQLRRTLAEKRERQYRALLRAAEETVARRLREKEAEVEKAARRNFDLEARSAQLSVEAQVWQAKARAQEATARSLQAQLQQAIVSGGVMGAQDQRDGTDGGGGVEGEAEDAESCYIDPARVVESGPNCRACRKRAASVVILPCRHLCLCTDCDRVVQACPLCFSLRNSSVEVFLS